MIAYKSGAQGTKALLKKTVFLGFCASFFSAGCVSKNNSLQESAIPNVVTKDIQIGIEKYIEDKTNGGNGYFRFSSDGDEFSFKLVKVHTEYLSNLGPRRHFACVDLVDTEGDVYDVDFFLAGDPEEMSVTETTLHKLNGQPFYAWEQSRNKTWKRVPIENASPELLGVKKGLDQFEFKYSAKLPTIKNSARMWIPLPSSDQFQDVEIKINKSPGKSSVLNESTHGNKILFYELSPKDSGMNLDLRFSVIRKEKAAYDATDEDLSMYLTPPKEETFKNIAEGIVKGKSGELVRSRALYDHVIDRISYIKYGTGWGKGDAVYACDARTGNCTDFHAYFIALARSIGIPARFAIGASIPSARDEGGISGYHCWAEFYAEGKWWPVDISEADKYTALSTYYFGHHPANRVEFSRGRNLVIDPGPDSGPINFLAYPVFESDGEIVKIPVKFSFKRKKNSNKTTVSVR